MVDGRTGGGGKIEWHLEEGGRIGGGRRRESGKLSEDVLDALSIASNVVQEASVEEEQVLLADLHLVLLQELEFNVEIMMESAVFCLVLGKVPLRLLQPQSVLVVARCCSHLLHVGSIRVVLQPILLQALDSCQSILDGRVAEG